MGYPIQVSTANLPLVFGPVVLSSDHITPTGDLHTTITVTISKNGGAFAAPAGAISWVGNGFYAIAANATDGNTLGPIIVNATVATADPFNDEFMVVSYNPLDAAALGLTNLNAAITTRVATTALPTNFSALSIDNSGHVVLTTGEHTNIQTDVTTAIGGPIFTVVSGGAASCTATCNESTVITGSFATPKLPYAVLVATGGSSNLLKGDYTVVSSVTVASGTITVNFGSNWRAALVTGDQFQLMGSSN